MEVGSWPISCVWEVCLSYWVGKTLHILLSPHIWFLSPFRNVPPDKHPGSQPWCWAPAPCLWKSTSTAFWPVSPPTHVSPCTGFATLLCSLLNSSFHTPPSSGAFQQQPSPPARRTAHDCPFPWLHKRGNTSYPTSPPSSLIFEVWKAWNVEFGILHQLILIETFSGFFPPQCKWNTFIFLSMSLQSSQAKHCSIVPAQGARYKHICLAALSGPLSSL